LYPTRVSPPQEMIKGEPYGYDADLWAFGVFVFEMLMGMCKSFTKLYAQRRALSMPEICALQWLWALNVDVGR
jgi:serine/threonine protein kinase